MPDDAVDQSRRIIADLHRKLDERTAERDALQRILPVAVSSAANSDSVPWRV